MEEDKEVLWEGYIACKTKEVESLHKILGESFLEEYLHRMMSVISGTVVGSLLNLIENEGDEEWVIERKEVLMKALEMLKEDCNSI